MNRLSRAGITVVLLVGALWAGGVAEARRLPNAVTVCVDSSSGVVRRVASSSVCAGGTQFWSASKPAPLLCWDASSLVRLNKTRLVSVASASGCVAPLRAVPVGKVLLLCADGKTGVLRWPMTKACASGNQQTWVRSALTPTTVTTTATTTSTTSTTSVRVPSVSLSATSIQGGTFPKAVTVTANVAGSVYFAEGDFVVKTVADITSAPSYRWAKGTVTSANTPTSIAIDVEAVINGYYRVFVANSQGILSAPATNIVTISVTRASTATTTTTTTVAVRTQTLDQSNPTWHIGGWNSGVSGSQSMGQSFTAGLAGPLSRISVGITSQGTVTQITAAIYASNEAGNAIGSALASKTIDGTTVPTTSGGALTVFDFASPVSVTALTKYVIVLTTPDFSDPMSGGGGDYSWFYLNGNGYVGGTGISFPLTSPSALNDFVFQTYVDI